MKSRRKIFSFIFLFVFLVSNTGVPLSLHLCHMMNTISTDECDMCSVKESEENCCSNDNGQKISSGFSECCQNKIAAEPLKDRFVSSKDEIKNIQVSITSEYTSLVPEPVESPNKIEIFGSPPQRTEQPLYILISSLLI